jgi:hypothetical protein
MRVEAYDEREVITMMHRLHRLFLGSCLAAALAACATQHAAPTAAGNSMPAAVPAWQPSAAAATSTAATTTAAAASKQQTPLGCVGSTGTRLPVTPGDCAGIGSVHSRTDIDRTGQPFLGPALQMIDPTVRASGP